MIKNLLIVALPWMVACLAGCNGPNEKQNAGAAGGSANAAPTTQPVQPGEGSGDHGREASRLVYQNDEIVSVLENGMVVIAKRVPSPALAVRGYVRAGGVFEGKWLGGGLSHLLEHLVAGGTNDRRSEAQNRNLLQRLGNNSNAYTTSDHTAYFVNTTPDNLDAAVDLVTGWMLGAHITPAEYRREYEVVQRELEKNKGEPDWVFYYLGVRNRYWVSPARVPVIGYQEVIRGLSRDDVYEYYKLAYVPNNMIFSVAGDLDPEKMIDAVRKHVKSAEPGRAFSHDIAEEPEVIAPRTIVATFPKLGEAYLSIGFPTIRLAHPDLYALDLLAAVLTRGQSSLLVQEIRDKRGLVTGIGAQSDTPAHVAGTFSIQMQLDPSKISETTQAVLDELERIKKEGISEDRLQRAKTQMKTQRAFSMQTADDVASSLATDFLSTGDPHFSDRYVARMQQVTVADIQRVAQKYFDPNKLLTTAMLPEESVAAGGLPKAEEILRSAAPTTQKTPEQPESKIVRAELGDGTILLLKRMSTSPVVVMNLYSLGGLTAEDAQTNGLGNLTMMTVTRGTKTRSAQDIAQFFDSIGGNISATCGNNSWNWSATCLKDDVDKALEVFADVVKNPIFPEKEVELMRRRTLAGIESQDADWFASSIRFFRKEYFGPPNSPYQFMAIGTKENVSRFASGDLRKWYEDRVLKQRRVLAIFGNIDVERTKQMAAAQFGAEKPATATKARRGQSTLAERKNGAGGNAPHVIEVRDVRINKTSNPQTGVVIGFDANVVVGQDVNYSLTVADTLASGFGYPTGYIFEILRGRGLIYDSHAFLFPGRSGDVAGTFMIYAGCDAKNANEVVDVILENIARLQGSPQEINADWFERSKTLIVTSDALHNETPAQQAATAALDELFGLGFDYHDQFDDRIRDVKIDEVRRAASALLSRCVVTVTTNEPSQVKIEKGVRSYQSFPPVDLTPKGVEHDAGK